MMPKSFDRTDRNSLSTWTILLMSSSALLWGCAHAPEFSHPHLSPLVSSDWLNVTRPYEMTIDETTNNAIEFAYGHDGFPIFKYKKIAESEYAHDAVRWTDWNAKATWWRLQVFDQTGTRICPKSPPEWEQVKSEGTAKFSCGPILKDHNGNVNTYVTLELDYVLSGDPNTKGTNHLTIGQVLALTPHP